MARYPEAIVKSTGELITIHEFLGLKPRPTIGSLVCPACDGILNGRDHSTDKHFYHKDILDSECPEAHYIHWKAIRALHQILQTLATGNNLFIKVEKHFVCDCPVHQEIGMNVPSEWSEVRIENLQGRFFDPRLEPDPERRWAPRLWIRVGSKEVRFEVSAGKSIAERTGVPTLEFQCSTDAEVEWIAQGRLELLNTRRFHWPVKVEQERCVGIDRLVWFGVQYSSGKAFVEPEPGEYSEYIEYRQLKQGLRNVSAVRCLPHEKARNRWEAQNLLFPVSRKSADTGEDIIIFRD